MMAAMASGLPTRLMSSSTSWGVKAWEARGARGWVVVVLLLLLLLGAAREARIHLRVLAVGVRAWGRAGGVRGV